MNNNELRKCESLGKLIGFFFNIVGLFAGFLYPQSSEERNRFIEGWRKGFIIFIVVTISFFVIFSLTFF